jgi:translation initiation factor IF-1
LTGRNDTGDFVASGDLIEMEGTVTQVFQGGNFEVETEEGLKVHAHLAGKLRRFRIRVVLGDKVRVEVSPYDLTKGRIIFRHK